MINKVRANDPMSSLSAMQRSARFAGKHATRIMAALRDEKSLTAGEMAQCTGMTVEQICRRLQEGRGEPCQTRGGRQVSRR